MGRKRPRPPTYVAQAALEHLRARLHRLAVPHLGRARRRASARRYPVYGRSSVLRAAGEAPHAPGADTLTRSRESEEFSFRGDDFNKRKVVAWRNVGLRFATQYDEARAPVLTPPPSLSPFFLPRLSAAYQPLDWK